MEDFIELHLSKGGLRSVSHKQQSIEINLALIQ
jgi:hypothetical protein